MNAIEGLKIKMTATDSNLVFEHLDKNKDGYINYQEFCFFSEGKRKHTDTTEDKTLSVKRSDKELKSNNNLTLDNLDYLEKLSNASQMYKGFKSNKLKTIKLPKHVNAPHYAFGVTSLPSDNIHTIITQGFASDYIQQ